MEAIKAATEKIEKIPICDENIIQECDMIHCERNLKENKEEKN